MSDPFIGQVQLFGFNFSPRGWAFCNGATLQIAQNTALFSLLGTTYGGNGTTTFQLPNLVGRAACNQGNGPGLTPRTLGESFGVNTVSLSANQIPQHSHTINAFIQGDATKRSNIPVAGAALSSLSIAVNKSFVAPPSNTNFAPEMLAGTTGGGLPHDNQQPYLGLNFCIALQGIYPSFPQ